MCPEENPTNKPCHFHPYAPESLREAMKEVEVPFWLRSELDGSQQIDVWCHGHDQAITFTEMVSALRHRA